MVDKYRKEQLKRLEILEYRIEMVERRMDEVERRECIIEDRISQLMQLHAELVKRLEVSS